MGYSVFMAEKRVEVKTYLVKHICEKCVKANSHWTTGQIMGSHREYSHTCKDCNHVEILDEKYPHIEHEETLEDGSKKTWRL